MLKIVNKLVNRLFGRIPRKRYVEDTSSLCIFNAAYHLDEFSETLLNILRTWLQENSKITEFDELDQLEVQCIVLQKISEHFPEHCSLETEIDLITDPYGIQHYNRINQLKNCLMVKIEFKHSALPNVDKLYMYWLISLHHRTVNNYKFYFKEESDY